MPCESPPVSRSYPRRRRNQATVRGAATATMLVRQPNGRGRQQPVHDTLVPFAVVVEYPGKGASLN